AGLMQLHAALSTPVVVTESNTNEAKVALKEVTENQASFELTAENFTDEAVSYEVDASLLTDSPVNADPFLVVAPNLFPALDLEGIGAEVLVNGSAETSVEVPAGGTADIEVSIDVSAVDAELVDNYFENGYWLDGNVTLSDPSDMNPDL